MSKHPSKYTPAEAYDLSDRMLFAGHKCEDAEIKALLLEGGALLLNRETTLAQVRYYVSPADATQSDI